MVDRFPLRGVHAVDSARSALMFHHPLSTIHDPRRII
jgi:hypothetical protein